MNTHDVTLLAVGGTAGAYVALLVLLLLSLWDDRRAARATLAPIPARQGTGTVAKSKPRPSAS